MRTILITTLLLVAGCSPSSGIMTREQFCKAVQGATADQVRSVMGPPDRVETASRSWFWKNRVKGKDGKVMEWAGVELTEDYSRVVWAHDCAD